MSKRLYVGNLLLALTQQELAEAFAPWGPVESSIIVMDHNTGQSRGFGFVDIPDNKVGEAIAGMNGNQLRGRPLIVNEAKPREAGPRDSRPRENRPGGGPPGGSFRRNDDSDSFSRGSGGPPPPDVDSAFRESGGRERSEAPRGNPRFGEDRPPQGGRGGSRERADRDRSRKEGGGRKERAPKRGRSHENEDDEPDW